MSIKYLTILLTVFSLNTALSQTWQSINKYGTFETAPLRSFQINPYTNDMWLIQDTKIAVIENDGSIFNFTDVELGPLWNNDNLQFAFTPTNVFYNINLYGFHSFTGYTSTLIDANLEGYQNLSSNGDTVYISMNDFASFRKFYNGTIDTFYKYFPEITAKNEFLYGHNGGSVIYQYIESTNTSVNLTSDPQYLFCLFNDVKFSRHSDTLYVGSTKGISYAYNYDFLDTITPNNTINMPSSNVLEIEFDADDSLWAVFGDINDNPFAIAKLEGNTWTNVFDQSNSPIDFSTFENIEIDTLGNLWVADYVYLHTLLTPNSPGWLSTNELKKDKNINLFPNPTSQNLSITSNDIIDQIQISDLFGRILKIQTGINSTHINLDLNDLSNGNYFVKVISGNSIEFLSFIKD